MAEITDHQIAHMTMIQAVINRVESNCFSLKALTMALAAAVIAFSGAAADATPILAAAAILPVVVFWWMDASYLRLGRQFRKLYDAVRKGAQPDAFGMDITPFKTQVDNTFRICRSWSVLSFYFTILIVLIVLAFYLHCN